MLNRLFYLLGLDLSITKMDKGIENDYTVYELRSFSFCKAEQIANDRLNRLDELLAVAGQIGSEDGFKNLKNLRKEIISSHIVEAMPSAKDKAEQNREAGDQILSMLNR